MKCRSSLSFALTLSTLILLAAIAVAQVPPPPPPPPPSDSSPTTPAEVKPATTKRGSITGQVLTDNGQPLIGVGVSAMRSTGGSAVNRSAITDEEGKFKINDLPLGSYHLGYQANGYVNPQRDAWKQPHRVGESVTLTLVKGGVITGKALDSAGQPLVGATVNAQRMRDEDGRVLTGYIGISDGLSDDRGVYRIYGLEAGSYVVFVNGGYGMYYDDQVKEAPTYHPNSTRDTAAEVPVQLGAVTSGIDVRHRGERGHAISGTLTGLIGTTCFLTVELAQATGAFVTHTNISRQTGKYGYALYGVAEGEYDLQARCRAYNPRGGETGAASDKRKVTIKGGDVTGIDLKLIALASMSGRVVLEPSEQKDCQITRRGALGEVRLVSLLEENDKLTRGFFEMSPDEKNEFNFQDLSAGRYRIDVQWPSDHWYLKAMTLAPAKPATKPLDIARPGINLKSGEKLTGLTLTLAEGAAELRGRVTGQNLPSRLRVHLVPAEKEAADEVLRYAEFVTKSDGAFTFTNLAPGKYWLHARAVPEDESNEKPAPPVAWDADARAKLRREAEAANNVLVLMACQRVQNHSFVFSSPVGK